LVRPDEKYCRKREARALISLERSQKTRASERSMFSFVPIYALFHPNINRRREKNEWKIERDHEQKSSRVKIPDVPNYQCLARPPR
jgi:hypothetical protein|tara:strand:- start:454 stop:711 length:258 start_codon:yes stop_codon:yes gene_type:complete